MRYIYLFAFFCLQITCFAQAEEPVKLDEVNKLKKHPDLWYVDKVFNDNNNNVSYDSLNTKKNKKQKVKKEAVTRRTLEDFLEIPPQYFLALKWFFYLSILIGVILLIMKGNFRMPNFTKNIEITTEITENTNIESAAQLQNIGFEQQILVAEQQGNYRLAVRLYYLWSLKKLMNKNLILFHIKKTNVEYVNELKGNVHHDEFEKCTKYYNYVWYGEFGLPVGKYEQIKGSFNKMLNQI